MGQDENFRIIFIMSSQPAVLSIVQEVRETRRTPPRKSQVLPETICHSLVSLQETRRTKRDTYSASPSLTYGSSPQLLSTEDKTVLRLIY